MKRIELSKEEKQVIRELRRGNSNIPNGMDNFTYSDAVSSLKEKRLVNAMLNYEDVLDVELTAKGYAYTNANPRLRNPINWTKIAALAACVAAVAATIALFISCSVIFK